MAGCGPMYAVQSGIGIREIGEGVQLKKLSMTGALMASAALVPHMAYAQSDGQPRQQPVTQSMAASEDEEIVVEGQKLRGSVVGDFTPELTMNPGDVRALGVSDISELVAELAPQLTSGRGGQPVVLLEGRRVSSFREIATIPTEAIQRVEILPEEVALKYGYPADQKVMNIILRRRFRAFTLEAKDRVATDGGANQAEGEAGFLSIRRNGRLNLNVEYQWTAALPESARGIFNTAGGDTQRTLIAADRQLTVTGTYAKPLATWLNSSVNVELTTDQTEALTGPSIPSVTIRAGTPYATSASNTSFTPVLTENSALQRSNSEQTVRIGTTLNADGKAWRGTLTSSYLHDEARTITPRGYDLGSYQTQINAGDPLANPALPVAPGFAILRPTDIARSRSDLATTDLTVNGNLYRLPAGEISLTAHIGGTYNGFESESTRSNIYTAASLDRSIGLAGLSVDVPLVKSMSRFIGKLSANGNVEAQSLSDFGTIKAYGFGLNWRPRTGVALIASFKGAESAPTVQQLGNPTITTTNVQVFDYQTGQTVNITQISGGNWGLRAADQDDMRLGLTLKPFGSKPDVTFSLDYNKRVARNGVGSLPGTTDAAEAAFGDRFTRVNGALVSIDTRSINIARRETSSIRWGLNFTKTIKTPQSQIDAMRKAQAARFPNGFPGRGGDGPPGERGGPGGPGGEDGPRPEGAGGGQGGGQGGGSSTSSAVAGGMGGGANGGGGAGAGGNGGGGGGFGGGPGGGGGGFGGRGPGGGGPGGGGRINVAIYHTVNLVDKVQLAASMPEIDLLNGGTLGERAGQPRHEVELQTGFSQAGFGARLTGKWESATNVVGTTGTASSNLHFSDIATFNLRLFANLGQRPELVTKMPWLRGARLQFGVNNILNTRQKVTDATGATPLAYRPGLVDPLGRTITLTLRKQLF